MDLNNRFTQGDLAHISDPLMEFATLSQGTFMSLTILLNYVLFAML